jgi:hypothetical protein
MAANQIHIVRFRTKIPIHVGCGNAVASWLTELHCLATCIYFVRYKIPYIGEILIKSSNFQRIFYDRECNVLPTVQGVCVKGMLCVVD